MGTGPECELFFPHRKCNTNFPNPNFKSSPCPHLQFREHSLSSLLIFQNRPSSPAWGFVGLFRPFQTPPSSQFQRPAPCTIMFSRSYNPTSLVPVLRIGYLWAPWQTPDIINLKVSVLLYFTYCSLLFHVFQFSFKLIVKPSVTLNFDPSASSSEC